MKQLHRYDLHTSELILLKDIQEKEMKNGFKLDEMKEQEDRWYIIFKPSDEIDDEYRFDIFVKWHNEIDETVYVRGITKKEMISHINMLGRQRKFHFMFRPFDNGERYPDYIRVE